MGVRTRRQTLFIWLRRVLLIFAGMIAIPVLFIVYRLTPFWLDYHFMVTTARQLVHSGAAESMSASQIRNDFNATLRLNHIQTYESARLQVVRESGSTELKLDYHIAMELLPGVDLSLTFNEDIP